MSDGVTILFRPIGQPELDLIAASGFRRFPPRLPGQPFFYPVLHRSYAEQIARDWNTRDSTSGFVGHVTQFRLPTDYVRTFDVRRVGGADHEELWVPAERLDDFNRHIVGRIEVVATFGPAVK